MGACFTGDIFGNRGLDTGHGQGEGQRENGRNQLIDSHSLCAEYIGEENPVEKANKAA